MALPDSKHAELLALLGDPAEGPAESTAAEAKAEPAPPPPRWRRYQPWSSSTRTSPRSSSW